MLQTRPVGPNGQPQCTHGTPLTPHNLAYQACVEENPVEDLFTGAVNPKRTAKRKRF